jgi:peptide/nickel transport system permease protein
LLVAVPTILLIALLTFALVRLAPGGPARALLGLDNQTPQAIAAINKEYHLNDPFPVQFAAWLGKAVQGNLGRSITTRQPVTTAVLDRMPVTLELTVAALLASLLFGVPLGVISAVRSGRAIDWLIRVLNLLGASVPAFVFGILFVLIFGWYTQQVLPYEGWVSLSQSVSGNLQHMILPTVSLSLAPIGLVSRLTRSALLDVLGLEYIDNARALGIRERTVIWVDALRNAVLPVLTVLGLLTTYLLGGVVATESVFNIPGVGRLITDGLEGRDYTLVSGAVLFVSILVVLVNIAIDVLYAVANPRIARRYQGSS